MIKAIIFDFGNVIYGFDNRLFTQRLSSHSLKTKSEIYHLIYIDSKIEREYHEGLISSDEFYDRIVDMCDLDIEKDEFIEAFVTIFTPIPKNIELIKKLQSKFKLALLSNTNEWDFNYFIKQTAIFELFDTVSLSFQLKMLKPNIEIFQHTINELEVDPDDCIFIDDIEENVMAARDIQIHGIHYTTHEALLEDFLKLGISIDDS